MRVDAMRRAPWLVLAVMPLLMAAIVGSLQAPGLVFGVGVAALLACVGLALLVRRFGAGAVWMIAIPLSILAGEVGSVGAGGQSGKLLAADAVVAVGVLVVLLRNGGVLEVPRAPFLGLVAAFSVWAALGLLTALDPLTAIAELKEWCVAGVAAAAAFAWATDRARAKLLLGALVVTAAAIACGMLVVTMTHPAGPVFAVMMKQVDLAWGRSNYLAGFLILALPLALGRALSAGTRRERGVGAAGCALCGMGLALSASKGAMLALVVTALPVFAMGGRGMRRAALIVVLLLVALALVFTQGPLKQVMTYRLAESAVDYSMNERVDLYRLAWESFLSHPLLGLGLNNFSVASHVLRGLDTVPHQLELGLLAEVGLPGTLLGLALLVVPLVQAWRLWRRATCTADQALYGGLLAAWAGMLAHDQVESTLYGEQFKLFIALLAAALWAFGRARESAASA
jgi:O-antigen ligase